MRKIEFYFDYVSNNAYLAWKQLVKLSHELHIEIEPKPILFTGLLNAHNNVGPAEVPAKRAWMVKNVLRKCSALGIPIAPPAHHPFNPLLALRASCMGISDRDRWKLIDGLFNAVWLHGQHVSEYNVIASVARDAGLDEHAILHWAQSPEASSTLRQQTDDAISKGVFGVPTMIIEGELFFGFDDLSLLEQFVKGNDPLDKKEFERWEQSPISPSSLRTR